MPLNKETKVLKLSYQLNCNLKKKKKLYIIIILLVCVLECNINFPLVTDLITSRPWIIPCNPNWQCRSMISQNLMCLREFQICDGIYDCFDMRDEKDCGKLISLLTKHLITISSLLKAEIAPCCTVFPRSPIHSQAYPNGL